MTVASPSTVTTLQEFATDLLAAAEDAVATTSGGAIEGKITPGEPALDCCPWLSVHVASLGAELTAPSTPATAPGHRNRAPGMLMLASLIVTVARCNPSPTSSGQTPTAAQLTAAALQVNEDLWAIWNEIYQRDAAGDLFNGSCPAMYLDPAVPLAPSGGCVGWTIQVRPAINGYIS